MSEKIRFAHLADLHLGAWREKTLTNLNFFTFEKAIDKVISEKVEFCLFAGDIFNNAIPSIDLVQKVVHKLMELKEAGIQLYVIGGSHDYSNSGKSFISLLESAQVFKDVCKFDYVGKNEINLKFTKDKSGTVISGILGKKNGLDKNTYKNLNSSNLSKDNFNIFMFHTTLNDFKPDFMKMVKTEVTKSYLPSGFDYYAGGHIHTHMEGNYSNGILSYPGPLFPNNFSELKREIPSFNLCEFDFETRETKIERVFLRTYNKEYLKIEIDKLNPIDAKLLIEEKLNSLDVKNKIILIEISGIVDGKISDVKIKDAVLKLYDNGAQCVLKNTYKLTSSDVKIDNYEDLNENENIEENIILEVLRDSLNKENESKIIKELFKLDLSKIEGEKNFQFEERVSNAIEKSLNNLKN